MLVAVTSTACCIAIIRERETVTEFCIDQARVGEGLGAHGVPAGCFANRVPSFSGRPRMPAGVENRIGGGDRHRLARQTLPGSLRRQAKAAGLGAETAPWPRQSNIAALGCKVSLTDAREDIGERSLRRQDGRGRVDRTGTQGAAGQSKASRRPEAAADTARAAARLGGARRFFVVER